MGTRFMGLTNSDAVPEKHVAGLRAKQLDMVRRMTFIIVLANLLNAGALLICFRHTAAGSLLYIWGAAILASSLVGAGTQFFNPPDMDPMSERSRNALDNFVRGALMTGLLWAAAPFIVMGAAEPLGEMMMGLILAGMMFAGTFLMARTPKAATCFLVPIGLGVVAAMAMQPNQEHHFISFLTLVYVGVLMLAVRWSHRQFVEQHLSELAVTEQSQLISLLLRDFEESTSDWLWQTDRYGKLQDIPLVFEGANEPEHAMRKGELLLDLFGPAEARTVLETSLVRRQGFRDLALQVRTPEGEGELWWSVTGKPIFENGAFCGFRGVATDITQSKESEDRIAYMAHYDGLTGLPNRMTMQEHLEKAIRKPLVAGDDRALIWLDLDNFKWVNDTLGHPAGDELLRQVSGRLTALCSEDDVVARISGDEFALIVERSANGGLEDFLDDLVECLSEPYDIWGSTANCTASVGVRLFDAWTSDTRVLLKHADLALYQAKKIGKGNWCMFTEELGARARARQEINPIFIVPSKTTSCASSSSPLSMRRRWRSSGSRRCCAGITRHAAWSIRASSSNTQRTMASLRGLATGSSARRCRKPAACRPISESP